MNYPDKTPESDPQDQTPQDQNSAKQSPVEQETPASTEKRRSSKASTRAETTDNQETAEVRDAKTADSQTVADAPAVKTADTQDASEAQDAGATDTQDASEAQDAEASDVTNAVPETHGQQDATQEDTQKADAATPEKDHAHQELSAEELDRVADAAIDTLRAVLAYFDAGDVAIDEYEGEDGELILDAVGADLAVLIGRYGKTLDALQFLVAAMVTKQTGYRYPIVIDVEGYRNRRRQKLEATAKSAAAKCVRTKQVVRLRPMTPHDRRIVHIILRNENRVFTESEGEEPNRCIFIKPC
ncbi:MAG: KH domain-containing protein [Coriobacteriales bacterium]|jgi:spoIIIJ-associated protein|nr:KH domain-containing protein [Coriobacteriales bacterium]